MTTSEKVAYLKGLAEGLGLGRETKEDKLIAAIIDTLDCIAGDIEDLEETTFDLGEEIDAISDDLAAVESVIYDECCCGDYDDDECCCHDHGHEHDDDGCCHDHGHSHDDGCCHDHGREHDDDGCCHDHGQKNHHGHGGSCCGGHGHHGAVMYEVTCPACDNTITIDEDVLNLGSIQCPNCGGVLEFDFDGGENEKESVEDKE